jgi:predicted deacylase
MTNVRGAFRVMRHLGMVPGTPELVANPKWIEPSEVLYSPESGLWYPSVRPNDSVAAGALLGRVTDYFGKELAEVRAPFAGLVIYVVASPAMTKGEPVGMVGVITT